MIMKRRRRSLPTTPHQDAQAIQEATLQALNRFRPPDSEKLAREYADESLNRLGQAVGRADCGETPVSSDR